MTKVLNRPLAIYTDNNDDAAITVNDIPVIDKDGGIAPGVVSGAGLTTGKGYFSVAVKTNGTSAVNVFGTGGAPVALTVTNVTSNSQDTSAANITLKQAANTVVTIAKGTASGGIVGGVTLAHTAYAKGDVCTVVSDGAHDAIVTITFQVA